ncbi:MAG: hypothetical protein V3V30_03795 [Parvularculaceae bacterium]
MSSFKTRSIKFAMISSVCFAALATSTTAYAQARGRIPGGPTFKLQSDFLSYNLDLISSLNYSNNPGQAISRNAEGDGWANFELQGGLIISRSKFTGIVNGQLSTTAYIADDRGYDQFSINQNIQAGGTLEVLSNFLYVDVAASATQRPLGVNSSNSVNSANSQNQNADAYSFGVSPYILHKFPNDASFEARTRESTVELDDSGRSNNRLPLGFPGLVDVNGLFDPGQSLDDIEDYLNDSESTENLVEFRTGGMFDRLQALFNFQEIDVVEDGSEILPSVSYDQRSYEGRFDYALSRKFSISVTYGEDEIETETQREIRDPLLVGGALDIIQVPWFNSLGDRQTDLFGNPTFRDSVVLVPEDQARIETTSGALDSERLSGPFWNAGFIFRPGRRTYIRAGFGERFGGDWLNASGRYMLSPRLTFVLQANRSLQTGLTGTQSSTRVLQQQTLQFVDQIRSTQKQTSNDLLETALSYSGGFGNYNQIQSGLSTSNAASAGVFYKSGHSEVSFNVSVSDDDFGFEKIDSTSAVLNIERRINRQVKGYGGIEFNQYTRNLDNTGNVLDDFNACRQALQTDPLYAAAGPQRLADFCLDPSELNGDSTSMKYQFGLEYALKHNLSGFSEYTYAVRDSIAFGAGAGTLGQNFETDEHVLTAGIRYSF